MTDDSLKWASRRNRQKISNNQLLDKEESGTNKSEHQTSVLGIISSTTVNCGRTKGFTLKKNLNLQYIMDKAKVPSHFPLLLQRSEE